MTVAIFIVGTIIFIATTTATIGFGLSRVEQLYREDAKTATATPEFGIKPATEDDPPPAARRADITRDAAPA